MPAWPPPLTDERALLLAYLTQQRNGLRYAAHGLTDEQARLAPSVSTLSLGGLIKHVAQVEDFWIDIATQQVQWPPQAEDEAAYENGFSLGPNETLEQILAEYTRVAQRTEAEISKIPHMNQPVPVPKGVPWFPHDVESWTVRWVLLHIIEETARHAGHADIVRESIDGATMYPLQAAAEGWPETEWLKPWKPAVA
ncbi:MAG: DinB family protein [Chloroflexota bacterium]